MRQIGGVTGGHQLDGFGAEQAHAVEGAAARQHLREPPVVARRRNKPGAAGEIRLGRFVVRERRHIRVAEGLSGSSSGDTPPPSGE